MQTDKYYDWVNGVALTESQGCPFDTWLTHSEGYSFSAHPDGFLVFLRPPELQSLDEYVGGDPYQVRDELDDAFQERRFKVTTRFVRQATLGSARNPKILDVGCGEGHITNTIHKAFPEAEISGIDCSLGAVKYARREFPGIDFAVGSAVDLPYVEQYFDVVLCNNIWEHVPDPLRMLASIKKVLRSGGHLIISTPSRYRMGNLIRALLGQPTTLISIHHVTEYSVGQVVEQLRYGGFEAQLIDGTPQRMQVANWRQFVAFWVLMPLVSLYSKLVRSHNSLASTAFYLAKKIEE
jgi:2-polyprenyl-3-methyl-5-hydroxy-6-metoxy-1,4-benzoquinol methylase